MLNCFIRISCGTIELFDVIKLSTIDITVDTTKQVTNTFIHIFSNWVGGLKNFFFLSKIALTV